MPGLIYDSGPNGLAVFVFVTLVLGGATARATGQTIARTWRPIWHLIAYAALLAAGCRFIQFALFSQPLLSLKSYLVDAVVLCAVATASYAWARQRQMAAQYPWLEEQRTSDSP